MSAPGAEWISDRSRENTPEEPEDHHDLAQQRTSKKRKVLSCYACRSRKMKCDRVFPVCGRCKKTGRSQECTYDPRLVQETRTNTDAQTEQGKPSTLTARPIDGESLADTSDVLRWKIQLQERRIAMLEQKLVVQVGSHKSSQYSNTVADEPDLKEEVMFRKKGFRSQFHGPTSVMSTISTVNLNSHVYLRRMEADLPQYYELHAFTREALIVDHSVLRIKSDFKQFRDRKKKLLNEHNSRIYNTDAEILAALPEQSIVEAQAVLYFETWERSYRILHEPTFWREYRNFWEENRNAKPQVNFAVILVLILAATKCLTPKDDMFIGDTTADRHAANHLLSIFENWSNQQPRKRVTLQFFQIQCLALLAKRVNSVKLKQDWIASGELLRLSLVSGMHRDAASLGHDITSSFEEEMKRRLWATIMELELQSSVETGLHTGLSALSYDTAPPANLSDYAFSTDTQQLPASQPSKQFTSASYLAMATRSLPLRIQLTQLLNNPSGGLQYADVLDFDSQIRSAISSLPKWEEEAAVLPSGLLRLQLRQYLLMLHKPYARLAHKDDRYMYSFTTCIDTCSFIITIHDDLLLKGILALSNMRNDVIRVGLTLSQIVYHNCVRDIAKSFVPPAEIQNTQNGDAQRHIADMTIAKRWKLPNKPLDLVTFPQEPFVVRLLCTSSIEIIERARQLFEQKVFRMGTGYMEYLLISAAVSMLPSPPSPATSIAYVNNAEDDIPARCRKTVKCFTNLPLRVLALQQDPENSLASSLRDTMASVSPSGSRGPDVGTSEFNGGGGARVEQPADGNCGFMPMTGVGMGLGAGDESGDLNGYVNSLQDMPVDMNGWPFPDFWAFDLSGDF